MTSPATLQLETTRLILKRPQLENAGAFTRMANNETVAQNRSSLPQPVTMSWAQEYLKNAIETFGDRSFTFGIYLKKEMSQPYIGEIALSALYNGEPALAYWLGENYWHNGYATEAVKSVINFSFSRLGAPFIEADYFIDNPASGKVLQKCGFEAVARKHFWSSHRMKFITGQSMLLTREKWAQAGSNAHHQALPF